MANIKTLGDSSIDNLYWMIKLGDLNSAKRKCVEGQLRQMGHIVSSHAYDGFTTRSVLGGDSIGAVLPTNHPAFQSYMKEKAPKQRAVYPLADLQDKISQEPKTTHHVVISVGGNDFRVNLQRPWRLINDIPKIQERYCQIVKNVKSLNGRVKPILVFQYLTDANQDYYGIYTIFGILGILAVTIHLSCIALLTAPIWALAGSISTVSATITTSIGAIGLYGSHRIIPLSVTQKVLMGNKFSLSLITEMMQRFYQPVLELAQKEGIPILDLPNTFNPYEPLYDSGIEPNEAGGQLIAKGIDHIVTHHDFSGKSKLYSKSTGQSVYSSIDNENPTGWTVRVP
ncbi:MAG: SGNH/GDSL hydrolase family protein [Verrucomicrobia bacterium]|nr:SGNH/GDSL hydrolase family protein [Verrucomicrobiota bacterium]